MRHVEQGDPHIDEAVVVLDDILCQMAEHQYKKNAILRQPHSWRATSGKWRSNRTLAGHWFLTGRDFWP